MLNMLLTWDKKSTAKHLKKVCRTKPKYLTFIICVGKSKEVFIGSPHRPAKNWTVLFVDLAVNQWY